MDFVTIPSLFPLVDEREDDPLAERVLLELGDLTEVLPIQETLPALDVVHVISLFTEEIAQF